MTGRTDNEELVAELRKHAEIVERTIGASKPGLYRSSLTAIESLSAELSEARAQAWDEAINTAREYGWLPVTTRGAFQAAFQAANPYRALTEGPGFARPMDAAERERSRTILTEGTKE